MGGMHLFAIAVTLIIVYKFIDLLLRLPRIGRRADRYIVVTGCDSGFGHELCKRLDSLGCHVFAGCLTEKGETELKKCCSRQLVTIHMDVSKPDSVRDAFNIVTQKLDADKVDLWGIVNNAGIMVGFGPPEWLSVDDYRVTADVNLYGLIDVTMTFLPLVKKSRGRVVNMSSSGGRVSAFAMSAYCVSKYGVEAFSDGLRRALRPFGCRVSIIEPGRFKTDMNVIDSHRIRLQTTWNAASQEVKDEFGDEYFHFLLSELPERIRCTSSDRLHEVVDACEHALLGRFPRARYLVGSDVKFLVPVLGLLPEWLEDLLMDGHVRDLPLPSVLAKHGKN